MNKIRQWLLNFVLNDSSEDGWMMVQRDNEYHLEKAEWDDDEQHYAIGEEHEELGRLRAWALDYVLGGSSADGWLLIQSGNPYTLEPAEYQPDANAYVVGDGEDKRFFEDRAGLMHSWRGVPLGLVTDSDRPIVDIDTAATAAGADQKITDGGELAANTKLSVQQIANRLKVGEVNTQYGTSHIVNPFHAVEDEPDVVDLRPATRLFPSETDPDTPRKAADNALEAERATEGLSMGNLTDWVQIVGSFLMGAIVAEYIAGSSGGGGVDVPLMLDMVLMMLSTSL
jgi:hypothetical protein